MKLLKFLITRFRRIVISEFPDMPAATIFTAIANDDRRKACPAMH